MDGEVFTARSLSVMQKTTEQNLVVCQIIKDCAQATERHEAFSKFSVTSELLVEFVVVFITW